MLGGNELGVSVVHVTTANQPQRHSISKAAVTDSDTGYTTASTILLPYIMIYCMSNASFLVGMLLGGSMTYGRARARHARRTARTARRPSRMTRTRSVRDTKQGRPCHLFDRSVGATDREPTGDGPERHSDSTAMRRAHRYDIARSSTYIAGASRYKPERTRRVDYRVLFYPAGWPLQQI